MTAVAHHALLGVSAAALGAAGLRVSSLVAPRGLNRALAAAALAVAAAVLEALVLGLFGVGGSAVALGAAAVATWSAAAALVPRPRLGPAAELASWWRRLGPAERLLVGALAGAGLTWTAWLLRYPALGYDTLLYHLPEAVVWVDGGTPGSVEPVVSGLPVGSYPLVHEVLFAWTLGLTRGFVPVSLLTAAIALLTAVAGWACLRGLRVPKVPAGLAVAAVLATPAAIAHGRTGAAFDPAALAWLAVCAALSVGSLRRPALLVPALVAGGLAIGTKTTALPFTAIVLTLAFVANRQHLRRLVRPLLAAGAAAALVGLFWYVRNLAQNGSPFWPFLTLPWSDPAPAAIESADISFLDRPGETLDRVGDLYLEQFAGGLVLLAGALAAPLLARRREVLAGAAATAMSLLLWLNAPQTGVSDNPGFDAGTADAVRYLLPGLGAAALTLALAARAGGPGGALATAALALALALGLLNTAGLGFPGAPSPATVLAGAAIGAVGACLAAALTGHGRGSGRDRRGKARSRGQNSLAGPAVAVAGAALLGAALSPAAAGYLGRHADTGLFDQAVVSFFDQRRGDERPVAISGALHGLLAGERLQRSLELLPRREPCALVERRLAREWVVFTELIRRRIRADVRDCLASRRPAHRDENFRAFEPAGDR